MKDEESNRKDDGSSPEKKKAANNDVDLMNIVEQRAQREENDHDENRENNGGCRSVAASTSAVAAGTMEDSDSTVLDVVEQRVRVHRGEENAHDDVKCPSGWHPPRGEHGSNHVPPISSAAASAAAAAASAVGVLVGDDAATIDLAVAAITDKQMQHSESKEQSPPPQESEEVQRTVSSSSAPPQTQTIRALSSPGAYSVEPARRGESGVSVERLSVIELPTWQQQQNSEATEMAPPPLSPHTLSDSAEILLNAQLVNEDEENQEVFEAKPAPEGFKALLQNKRFKYVVGAMLLIILVIIVPTSVVVTTEVRGNGNTAPATSTNSGMQTYTHCGTIQQRQMDYRGNISVSEDGIPCQLWSTQHTYLPENFPGAGLAENHCRNPDGDIRAWCFPAINNNNNSTGGIHGASNDSSVTPEDNPQDRVYCSIPTCEIVERTDCGTLELMMVDYRGTINVTKRGIPCQRWDSQYPHAHDGTSAERPYSGRDENYCRQEGGKHIHLSPPVYGCFSSLKSHAPSPFIFRNCHCSFH